MSVARKQRSAEAESSLSAEQLELKKKVLTRSEPSVTDSIAEAVVIKDEDTFFVMRGDGDIPFDKQYGMGLYHRDCRYLRGYEFRICGQPPTPLVANSDQSFMAIFQLTNFDIDTPGGETIRRHKLGIQWIRKIEGGIPALREQLTFVNHDVDSMAFPVSFSFDARFEDVFAVRGLLPEFPGRLEAPEWKDDSLRFVYRGSDEVVRVLTIVFSEKPASVDGATVMFDLEIEPQQAKRIGVSFFMSEGRKLREVIKEHKNKEVALEVDFHRDYSPGEWMRHRTSLESDSVFLNRAVERSMADLKMLSSRINEGAFFSAGLPWFGTLFGRDSIITAIQTLAFNYEIAEQTLRLLACMQGSKVDEWKDEEPGKILHELRRGELAATDRIPHSPYYGAVDTTPLFLILLAQHSEWTGSTRLFSELRGNVERALEWIDTYSDHDGDGYADYSSPMDGALINQGWKDAGNSIVCESGSIAKPPIALVEVQAYIYQAKLSIANLFLRAGDHARAKSLRGEAEKLRKRFERDFWFAEEGTYDLALQKGGKPTRVVSSNAGHALWAGISEGVRAGAVVKRLLQEDMFSGWGVRTLSTRARRYNPIGYHLGTVWPHDNSIIAAGMKRYGFDKEASRIFRATLDACLRVNNHRLPEAFSGFPRNEYGVPVGYPVACHPQAWAAGTIPYLITTMLGLVPEAFDGRLKVVRPLLPDYVDLLDIRQLRVGKAEVDLRFRKIGESVAVEVLKLDGDLKVVIEP